MFRIWGKQFQNNHLLKDIVIEDGELGVNRTTKVFRALEEICVAFDLSVPIWLDNTIHDFQHHSKCRFTQDNFIEQIDFDFLEIHVIEEDGF